MADDSKRKFHRKPAVREAMGWGNSTLYDNIKRGLFPPPIKVGLRISVWLSDETAAIQDAYVAGLSDDDIRRLVENLMVARTVRPAAACGVLDRPSVPHLRIHPAAERGLVVPPADPVPGSETLKDNDVGGH